MSGATAYFAYGSNMDSTRFRERIPSAQFVAIGWVDGWKVVYHKVSKDGSGKADMVPSPGSQCWGVVYRIGAADLARLDRIEAGYGRTTMVIRTGHDDRVAAMTYVARETDDSLTPFDWYMEHIIRGAAEHGLPVEYIGELRRIPTRATGGRN